MTNFIPKTPVLLAALVLLATPAVAHPQHLDDKTQQPMKPRVRRKLHSVEGTDQDWLRHTFGTLALLVEGAHWTSVGRRWPMALQ